MAKILGKRQNNIYRWFSKKIERSNSCCLYCGHPVDEQSNMEHVIGRNFVPKNSFAAEDFNFIFRACINCNREKSRDEGHVSGITILSSPARAESTIADEAAVRKAANEYHPDKPGTLLGDSCETRDVTMKIAAGLDISFGFTAPPQIKLEFAQRLAQRHIQALYSLVTTVDLRKPNFLSTDRICIFKYFPVNDWGNPQLKEIAHRVQRDESLAQHVSVQTASGFFKVVMKRSNSDQWFWAIEWNKNLRVTGCLVGIDGVKPKYFEDLPAIKWQSTPARDLRYRQEVPFENDYQLFDRRCFLKGVDEQPLS